MRQIIMVTSSFPFGVGEASFIIPELKILAKKFKITIVSKNSTDTQTSEVPEGVNILRYDSSENYSVLKLLFKTLTSPYLYKEIRTLISKKKISAYTIKRAVRFCMRSFHLADYLKKVRDGINDDVILYSYWNDVSVFAFSHIKREGDKILSRAHRTDLYLRKEKNYYLPLKEISNIKTDMIVFISKEGKEYFENHYKTDAKKEVYYLGVKEQQPDEYIPKDNEISLISFSYAVSVKRIDRIIEALEKIDSIKINWVHIGDGDKSEELKQLANNLLGKKENIIYNFTGGMENSLAIKYIKNRNFDLFINTSESEGLPVTMMEAMSLGIPVIGLNVGGVSEIVKDKENGFLLPSDADCVEIAGAIEAFNRMKTEEKIIMKQNALKTWKEKFNCEKNHKEFAEMISNLL